MLAFKISKLEWGKVEITDNRNNAVQSFKDAVIWPGRCKEWNFNDGFDKNVDTIRTCHQTTGDDTWLNPTYGIQIHSVRPYVDFGDVFILTTGMNGMLGVNIETVKFLEDKGKVVNVVHNQDVMNLYNELSTTQKVVAFIHSTC
jgi:hypothetical protein